MIQPYLFSESPWISTKDGDDTGRTIFRRHYSYRPYADGRDPALFVGPGEKLVLLTPCAKALFVWRKFISGDGQEGVNCSVFRNEGAGLSSRLILDAESVAFDQWGAQRLFTYVNPRKLHIVKRRGSPMCPWPPGRCFIEAGWRQCGVTKHRKLLIFEKLPTNVA